MAVVYQINYAIGKGGEKMYGKCTLHRHDEKHPVPPFLAVEGDGVRKANSEFDSYIILLILYTLPLPGQQHVRNWLCP
jgi:hypothetical protein